MNKKKVIQTWRERSKKIERDTKKSNDFIKTEFLLNTFCED